MAMATLTKKRKTKTTKKKVVLFVSSTLLLFLTSLTQPVDCFLPRWLKEPIEVVSELPVVNKLSSFVRSGRSSGDANPNGQSNSSSSSSKGSSDNFGATCLLDRQPQWTDNPTVYFFSGKKHSKKNFGCVAHLSFSLNISKSLELATENDNLDDENEESPTKKVHLKDLVVLDENNDDKKFKRNLLHLYNGSLPSYLLIHGFMSSWNADTWMCHTKDMILNNTQANVFIIDWSGGAKPMLPIDYGAAVTNTKYVGLLVGSFIKWLLKASHQPDAMRFHLIGHSLGAHIAGYIGYYLGGSSSLGRITGLDPAGPCFTTASNGAEDMRRAQRFGYLNDDGTGFASTTTSGSFKRRLSMASAQLVVAMHTDTSLFGLNDNCAHYNVYVNGGSRQPFCHSLVAGVSNLLLRQSFDLDISCAHTYAHEILDSFAIPHLLLNELESALPSDSHSSRREQSVQVSETVTSSSRPMTEATGAARRAAMQSCYPIAYRCRTWDAFKMGECGFCADNSTSCVFTGVELSAAQRDLLKLPPVDGQQQTGEVDVTPVAIVDEILENNEDDDDDDDKFNDESNGEDEADYEDADLSDQLTGGSAAARALKATTFGGQLDPSPNNHFLKAAPHQPTCLYHYQVVIAVQNDKEQKEQPFRLRRAEAKRFYYLQIPLDEKVALLDSKGHRARDRLVQVSHVVRGSNSVPLNVLRGPYLENLRKLYPNCTQISHSQMSNLKLDFYTALITFESTSTVKNSNQSKDKSGNWRLKRPLVNLREARLWSATGERLRAVHWVALNYMSGLTERVRSKYSHLFAPPPVAAAVQVKSREEISKNDAQLPSIDELNGSQSTEKSNWNLEQPLRLITGTALKPVNCLLSSVWEGGTGGSSRNNFKCGRGESELKFAVKLSSQTKSKLS